jgi:hypothetical protein
VWRKTCVFIFLRDTATTRKPDFELSPCFNVVCFLLGYSPASEFKCQRFGTLCLLHFHRFMKMEQTECSETLVLNTRQGVTQNKAYNNNTKTVHGNDVYQLLNIEYMFRPTWPLSGKLDPRVYDRLDIRTTWVTTKILVLTYDQNLELRPACRSRPLELRPAWRS